MVATKELTATDFRRCLLCLRPHSWRRCIRILDAHYRSPNHTATPAELAAALEYQNGRPLPPRYSYFAATLKRFFLDRFDFDLSLFSKNPVGGWVLNPELVKALDEITGNGRGDLEKVLCSRPAGRRLPSWLRR